MSEAATLERPAPWHNGGESAVRSQPTCSISDCERPAKARGYCGAHAARWRKYADPLGTAARPTIEERFSRQVERTATCWLWRGALGPTNGYGYFTVRRGKVVLAHKWSYEAANGAVPDGLELDHLCRTHACVRPDHLEPVTHRENMLRGKAASKTHCNYGHALEGDNVYARPDTGARQCKTCRRAAKRRYDDKHLTR